VRARPELVSKLAQVDELRDLRLADDELRAVLDLLVLVGEAERKRVARIIGPLDDVDKLFLQEIEVRRMSEYVDPSVLRFVAIEQRDALSRFHEDLGDLLDQAERN